MSYLNSTGIIHQADFNSIFGGMSWCGGSKGVGEWGFGLAEAQYPLPPRRSFRIVGRLEAENFREEGVLGGWHPIS